MDRTSFAMVKIHTIINNYIKVKCYFTAIMCLPLTHYNGSVEYSSPRPPYSFGTQAIYLMISCPEGTETRGGDSTRTCTGDGHSTVGVWSGTAPICAGLYAFS